MIAEILRTCAGWTALLLLSAGVAMAEGRVALVIGNSAYQHAGTLPNPVNDARSVAELFRKAGFNTVQARTDVGNLELRRSIREFTETARGADIAVVFFAGHGIEIGGINYLVPVDARLAKDLDAEDEAVPLDRLVRALEPARRLRLIILDACRDNPFVKTIQRTVSSRAVTNGLVKVEPASSDTLIAYAAKAGSIAEDGTAANSPFTSALIRHLAEPGLDIRLAFGRIRDEVLKNTGNKQEPFVYGSLGGTSIALVPAPVAKNPVEARNPVADIRADYELAERVGTKASWESFIKAYPTGFYSDLARAQLAKQVEQARRLETEQQERARLDGERQRQAAREQADRERAARETAEREKLAREQSDKDRLERERLAAEQSDKDRLERERLAAERRQAEHERVERERLARERTASDMVGTVAERTERAPTAEAAPAPQAAPPANIQTAMLTLPDKREVETPLAGGALVVEIKKELRRLGCYQGRIDGDWKGDAASSVENFARHARLGSPPRQPDTGFLDTLRGKTSRVCPLECGSRETERNGRCVTKSCSGGRILDEDGNCQRPKQRTASRPPEARHPETPRPEPRQPEVRQPGNKPAAAPGRGRPEGEQQVRCGRGGCQNFVRSKQMGDNCLRPRHPGQKSFLCRQ